MKYSKKNNSIQVSKKDMELLIREIFNPKKPNDNLKSCFTLCCTGFPPD